MYQEKTCQGLPFHYIEFLGGNIWPCYSMCTNPCVATSIDKEGANLKEIVHSKKFQDFRKTCVKGTYEFCTSNCEVLRTPCPVPSPGPLNGSIVTVNVGLDEGCNLACRTCRDDYYFGDYETAKKRIKHLEDIADEVECLQFCSAGDPFYSKAVREWLISFDPAKFPKLRDVLIRTNGVLIPKYWPELTEVKKLIHRVWLSLDSVRKETYEYIRRGNKWEHAERALEFIGNIESIHHVTFSFVCQQANFDQIPEFQEFVRDFGKKYNKTVGVFYQGIEHWPGVSDENFKLLEPTEEQYQVIIRDLQKINAWTTVDFRKASVSSLKTRKSLI